jgi:hypothetical protein
MNVLIELNQRGKGEEDAQNEKLRRDAKPL